MLIVEVLSADSEAEEEKAEEAGRHEESGTEGQEGLQLEERTGSHAAAGPGS